MGITVGYGRATLALLLALTLGCSDTAAPTDPPVDPNARVVLMSRAAVLDWLDAMVVDLQALKDAIPAADADGWSAETDPEAVAAMRAAWLTARARFQRLDLHLRMVHPEIEGTVAETYTNAVFRLPDDNLFDDQGFIGWHAIERILWAGEHPPRVLAHEQALPHYRPARFPANAAEAAAFEDALVGGLLRWFEHTRDAFGSRAVEPTITLQVVIGALVKHFDKLDQIGHDEFRPGNIASSYYSDTVLADWREALTGAYDMYAPFRLWLVDAGQQELADRVEAGWQPVFATFDTIPGPALPPAPPGWSHPPSPALASTLAGRLYFELGAQVRPDVEGSLVRLLDLMRAALIGEQHHRHTVAEGPLEGLELLHVHPAFGEVIPTASHEWRDRWEQGHDLSEIAFTEEEGLGPYYVKNDCVECHFDSAQGTRGKVETMVVVGEDGVTPLDDQSALPFGHTVREELSAGAHTPLSPPAGANILVAQRAAPSMFGRGYVEAVDDAEILRVAAEQAVRDDGISGRVNRVTYQAEPNPLSPFNRHQPGDSGLIGRFGVKSQIATLDDFISLAYQSDMGLTNPLRPTEPPNPDGLTDDALPGVDVDLTTLNLVSDFVRLIDIPERGTPRPVTYRLPGVEPLEPLSAEGAALFEQVRCAVCHVPSLRTRDDYPVGALAGIDAWIYSDLLLHDMGADLADGMEHFDAGAREWRTPPLIALRALSDYLHDGRAATVDEAIRVHGAPDSEAFDSVQRYLELSEEDRAELLRFVEGL